ncbi:class D sortase [Paenibacillus sp. JSM ZJ436]|uniref:class D sortase n=1 Tax=Paenibacillus sp. JSM ZJ436 TaxID=3376190 RepID=UPI00379D1959
MLAGLVTLVQVLHTTLETDRIQKDLKAAVYHEQVYENPQASQSHPRAVSEKPGIARTQSASVAAPKEIQGVATAAEGVLKYPSIGVDAAVVSGVSEEELNHALGIMGEDVPGTDGSHAVIAGHRSGITGKFFNTLHQAREGDVFSYHTSEGVLRYKVVSLQVVTPDKIDAVRPVPGESRMTLVTCYPNYSNAYRLLVTGIQVD